MRVGVRGAWWCGAFALVGAGCLAVKHDVGGGSGNRDAPDDPAEPSAPVPVGAS